ncbi:MAG: hypothetical protein H6707_01935 [Deltaproteobacteria bacterium]|nr:hypothetical protein [Deltaproteobacteria bacterium]
MGWPLQWEDAVLAAIPFLLETLLERRFDLDQIFAGLSAGRGNLPLGIVLAVSAIGLLLAVALSKRPESVGGGLRQHAWAFAWPGYGTLVIFASISCGMPQHFAALPLLIGIVLFRPWRRRQTPPWIRRLLAAPATFVCAAYFAHLAQLNAAGWAATKAPSVAVLWIGVALLSVLGIVPYTYFVVGPRTLAGAPFRIAHWLLRYALFLASLIATGSGWLA